MTAQIIDFQLRKDIRLAPVEQLVQVMEHAVNEKLWNDNVRAVKMELRRRESCAQEY